MSFPIHTLHQLGWRPAHARGLALEDFEHGYPARVTARRHGSVSLLCSRGAATAALAAPMVGAGIVAGDWVMVARSSGRVSALLPRHSLLQTDAPATPARALAANLDAVLVAGTLGASLDVPRLQRGLLLARAAGVAPVLVLRADGVERSADVSARLDALRRWLPAAAVLLPDAAAPASLARLSPWLAPGHTAAWLDAGAAWPAWRADEAVVRYGAMTATPNGAWVIATPTWWAPSAEALAMPATRCG